MVALEPSTGKILAMVSAPSYDPNLLATHDVAEQAQAWQRLRDDPDSPLLNRAISETYPPGSTFKVLTTAAALQSGATPDTQLTAAPQIALPDSTATLENFGGSSCGGGPTASLQYAFAQFLQHGLRPARHQHRRRPAAHHRAGDSGWTSRHRRSRCRSPTRRSARSRTPRRWG